MRGRKGVTFELSICPVQVGEPTPPTPTLKSARPHNLYQVAEDCAAPKDDEGILYIHKGEVHL